MNPNAPQPNPAVPMIDMTADFEGPSEITGVRKVVRSTIGVSDYPARPNRTVRFDKLPPEKLEHELEAQIDEWSSQRMLKTQITVDSGNDQQSTAEMTLKACQSKGKIHGFEVSEENGKTVFTVYYKYRTT